MRLDDILTAVRPVLLLHHLAVMQDVETRERGVSVVTRIVHASGRVFESSALVLACAQDPQSVGSAITYAKRYSLSGFLGIAADDDDDGQAAQAPRAMNETYGQTRPVTRAKKTADDPQDAPFQTPPAPAPARPVVAHEVPDATNPRASRLVTDDKVRKLWIELRKTEWSDPMIREWVRDTLDLGTLEWHTHELLGWQVDVLIDRLKPPVFDPGPDRRRAGQ